MDIKVNNYSQNFAFCARRNVYNQLQMLHTMPDLLAKNTPLEQIAEQTGRTQSSILRWVKENTGKTFKQINLQNQKESLRELLAQYIKEDKNAEEIAKLIGKSVEWTRKCLQEYGLLNSRETINKILDEQLNLLIKKGFTIEKISKTLNISENKIRNRIKDEYGKGIVEFRHQNNVKITHEDNPELEHFKEELERYIANNMTITDISKATGRPQSRIYYWLDKFGLSTQKQDAHKNMKKFIPKMMKQGVKLYDIAKTIGLSEATISRWVKKTYGKTYTELRLCK